MSIAVFKVWRQQPYLVLELCPNATVDNSTTPPTVNCPHTQTDQYGFHIGNVPYWIHATPPPEVGNLTVAQWLVKETQEILRTHQGEVAAAVRQAPVVAADQGLVGQSIG